MSINENTRSTTRSEQAVKGWYDKDVLTPEDRLMLQADLETEFAVYPDTCPRPRVFSNINNPLAYMLYEQADQPEPEHVPRPQELKLQRQTNNWQLEFGEHPDYFALITDYDSIERKIANTAISISAIVHSELIAIPGPVHKYSDLRSLVMRYIIRATEQLNQLQLAGEITFTKNGNKRIIHLLSSFEMISIEFLLCDFTGYIHTIVSQTNWIVDGRPCNPSLTTPAISSFTNIMYNILTNKHLHFYTTLARTYPKPALVPFMTHVYSLGEFPNEVDGVVTHAIGFEDAPTQCADSEPIPEWVNDTDSTWNFPETEPFQEPGLVYDHDIISTLSLQHPDLTNSPISQDPESPEWFSSALFTNFPTKLRREISSDYYIPTIPEYPYLTNTHISQDPESPELPTPTSPAKLRREISSDYAIPTSDPTSEEINERNERIEREIELEDRRRLKRTPEQRYMESSMKRFDIYKEEMIANEAEEAEAEKAKVMRDILGLRPLIAPPVHEFWNNIKIAAKIHTEPVTLETPISPSSPVKLERQPSWTLEKDPYEDMSQEEFEDMRREDNEYFKKLAESYKKGPVEALQKLADIHQKPRVEHNLQEIRVCDLCQEFADIHDERGDFCQECIDNMIHDPDAIQEAYRCESGNKRQRSESEDNRSYKKQRLA